MSDLVGPPSLRFEAVEEAVRGLRLLDMQGIDTQPRETWESVAEEAAERWAIRSETGPACSGLVSVPTSGTRRSRAPVPFAVQAETAALLGGRQPRQARGFSRAGRWQGPVHAVVEGFGIDTEARRLAQLRMHVGFAARAHCVEPSKGGDDCVMVTLTYAGTNDAWNPRHVSDFIKRVRQWLARRDLPCRYVWVAELQQRGVIHYHVALWVPRGFKLPMPDKQGWWPHGFSRIEVARAAVPYLLKYLSKDTSKTFGNFPKGARIYGIGGLDFVSRRARRWLSAPGFVRRNAGALDQWNRAPGGGWTSPEGTLFPSEFRRAYVGSGPALVRVHKHGGAWPVGQEPCGPFLWLSDRDRARELGAVRVLRSQRVLGDLRFAALTVSQAKGVH